MSNTLSRPANAEQPSGRTVRAEDMPMEDVIDVESADYKAGYEAGLTACKADQPAAAREQLRAIVQAAPGNTAGRRDPLSWPQLQQANGELQINQSHLQLKSASARLGTQGQVQVGRLEVLINDLNDIAVDVNAQFKGNLSDAMQVMLGTPLRDKLGPWMNPGLVNGLSEHELHLHLFYRDTQVQP